MWVGFFVASVIVFLLFLFLKGLGVWSDAISDHEQSGAPSLTQAPEWEFAGKYRRRTYLFYSVPEFNLFNFLVEVFGDKYHIFTQVALAHLVEPVDSNFYEHRKYRTKIDKKSVDFVLCDKQRVVPKLVIELDGISHSRWDRRERDEFVDKVMEMAGIPILHIRVGTLNPESTKIAIERALDIRTGESS